MKSNTTGNQQEKHVCFCELCQPDIESAVFSGDEAETLNKIDLRRPQVDLTIVEASNRMAVARN